MIPITIFSFSLSQPKIEGDDETHFYFDPRHFPANSAPLHLCPNYFLFHLQNIYHRIVITAATPAAKYAWKTAIHSAAQAAARCTCY
jgi:hypothetical protein